MGQLHLAIGDAIAPLTRAVPIVDRVTQPVPNGIGDVEVAVTVSGLRLVRGDAQVRGRWPVDPWPGPTPVASIVREPSSSKTVALAVPSIRVLVLQRDRPTRGQGLLGFAGPSPQSTRTSMGSDAVVGHHLQRSTAAALLPPSEPARASMVMGESMTSTVTG